VTIRKQKQIFLYDFEFEVYFDGVDLKDKEQTCKGKIKIHEINQDDDELVMDVSSDQSGELVSRVKSIINSKLNEAALKVIMSLGKAMRERDADEIKVKKDKMEREQAKKLVEEAKEKNDDVKA
jgi:activator of HSP90 ATPase